MTESQEHGVHREGSSKAGWAIFVVAAVLAASAIGWKVWNSADSEISDDAAGAGPSPSVEQLRERAEEASGDARAWQELGFALFQRGEFLEAAKAYERAVAADESEAVLWSALGEARVMASQRDPMPPEALTAFRAAIERDPRDPRARYFLAVQKDLGGDHEGAIADWIALLADTPRGAPWESDLVRTIEQVGTIRKIDVDARIAAASDGRLPGVKMSTPGLPGPTQEQVAAAGSLSPAEQRTMARGMVDRLEQRLAADPANVDGWIMLMRSRMNLGEPKLARNALERAISANPGAAQRLRSEARGLGIQ